VTPFSATSSGSPTNPLAECEGALGAQAETEAETEERPKRRLESSPRHHRDGVAQMVEAADQSQTLAPDSALTVECQINREWTEIAEMPVRIRLGAPLPAPVA
jgi:hypothetical protein